MPSFLEVRAKSWMLRSVPLLLLITGIALAPMAQVAQAAAPAIDNSVAAITVFAPGAPLGSPVTVQYSDGSGNWLNVAGWTGTLDRETDNLLVPFKQWIVFPANYGQGPFRWVVFNADGTTIWGISDTFNLPPGGGINQSETIVPGVTGMTGAATGAATPAAPAATPTPAPAAATPSAPANSALLLTSTGSSYFSLPCGDCSALSGYFKGLPSTSWITVEWGDGQGHYEAIQGWQGTADTTDTDTGQLIKHFTVFTPNFGQGPFRWAVYDRQGGTLLAFSSDFTLPAYAGVNFFMSFMK